MEAFTICLSVDKEVEGSIYREYKLLSYVAIGEAAQSKLFYVANFKYQRVLVYCCTTHYYRSVSHAPATNFSYYFKQMERIMSCTITP